jgi:nicotinate-nucleotide adenylyltransferase
MAENAMDQLGLDLMVFAPAGDPPHKPADDIVDAELRLHLVNLAIAGRPGFVASRIDIDTNGPSYTWQLLERCHAHWPNAAFTFVVGGDSLAEFATWSRPSRILELARLAVIHRPGFPLTNEVLDLVPGLRTAHTMIDTPMCSISSTAIRERVASRRTIRYLVPDPVRNAIATLGLYATSGREGIADRGR